MKRASSQRQILLCHAVDKEDLLPFPGQTEEFFRGGERHFLLIHDQRLISGALRTQ